MSEPLWFSARLLFESEHPDEPDVGKLFEDRIVLLLAEDEDEANRKAELLGAESQHDYKNQFGKRVIWRFVELLDLSQLARSKIGHGSEVYSQLIDEEDLAAVRRSLRPGKFGDDEETVSRTQTLG